MNPSTLGAIRDTYDIRDYHYAPRGAFDWEKGVDITKKLPCPIVIKDQDGSGSCGGQAWAYLGEVLEAIATGTYEPRSARWVYSHCFVPGGGSDGKTLCDFVVKNGFAKESDATSYENGKPPSEQFMETIPELNAVALDEAQTSKALSYLKTTSDINVIAQAIEDNNGCAIALDGQDNGTWRTDFPQPPTKKIWAHWLATFRAFTITPTDYNNWKNKQTTYKELDALYHFGEDVARFPTQESRSVKLVGYPNSWGVGVGEDGWQYLREDYFPFVWYGWTLAWDYTPAAHKVAMIKMIALLTQIVNALSALLKLKK